jgi:predicted nucleic acid-binding protein
MQGATLAISFQTVAELWSWAEESQWGPKLRAGLEAFMAQFVLVPYSPELAQTWARVMTHTRRAGRAWRPAMHGLHHRPYCMACNF